jgi:outer membrane protein OmpA-like peptidoglycan-associated protein
MRRRPELGLGEIWIVVADVMLGFLLLVLIVLPHNYTQPDKKGTYEQPAAVAAFVADLIKIQKMAPIDFSPPRFAELNITFRSDLLFKKCDWTLTDQGRARIDDFARLLWKRSALLDRVEIKGYADRHPADDCSSLWNFKQSNLGADNWNLLLSSLRAMSVQQALIDNARKDVDQSMIDRRVKLLEAVGKGDLHPRDPDHPDDSRDRRVEILVHFIESNTRDS